MYNLLVIQGWPDQDNWERDEGVLSEFESLGDRVFESTDDSIADRFRGPDGNPDFDALMKLPCLFTYEGSNVQGSIGWITEVQAESGVFKVKYCLPGVYPKLALNEERMFRALGMGRDNTRTRWEVKDRDLFEAVVRLLVSNEK